MFVTCHPNFKLVNLFKRSLELSGYKIEAAQRELDRLELSPTEMQEHIKQKKWDVAQHHFDTNPFYRKLVGKEMPQNWEVLPILNKSDLQNTIAEHLSQDYTTKNIYLGKTSGSSGQPFVFAKDKWCHALSWASFYAHYLDRGIDLYTDLQARFYGMPSKGLSRYREKLKDKLSSRYRFPIFDLSMEKMDGFLDVFKAKPFAYLNGYTSSILLFAKYLEEKNIVLKAVCPSLKACITTSEMLFKDDRATIEKALGVRVINEYGASESGLIAFEDSSGRLVIDQKLLFVEILDEQNRVLPYGEIGRITITALYNKAYPLIRYAIGDMGSIIPGENSKDMLLQQLSGRSNDNVHLPSGKTVPGLAFYYVTKKLMEKSGNVREIMVTQNSLNTFSIAYVSELELHIHELKKLKKAVAAYLEPGLNLNIERKLYLDRSLNGKLKQFKSLL